MPSRVQTTRSQLSAARYSNAALAKGFINRSPNMPSDPTSLGRMALLAAGVAIAVALLLALLLKVLNPAPNKGAAEIMMTQQGGMYVQFDGALHPVTNLSSARLIVGKADKPSIVNEKTLADYKRGPLMGIPSAPNSMKYRGDKTSKWGLCEWHDTRANLSLTHAETLQTTVVAGTDSFEGGRSLGTSTAVLAATESDPDTLWLLFGDRKARIGKTDYAVQSALGITPENAESPLIVSTGMLNTIPASPDLTAPNLARKGQESGKVQGYQIGDVLSVSGATSVPDFYAVTMNGIQQVPYVVAQLLLNDGGERHDVADPQSLSMYPRAGDIKLSTYPAESPTITVPDALCYTWSRDQGSTVADTDIITASSLPVKKSHLDNKVSLLKTSAGTDSAHVFVTKPGSGWYVRATASTARSEAEGQLFYVDDSGVRYAVMPDEKGDYSKAITALGLSGEPLMAPDAILRLLLPGADLDRTAALTEHANIPFEYGASAPDSTGIPEQAAQSGDYDEYMADTRTSAPSPSRRTTTAAKPSDTGEDEDDIDSDLSPASTTAPSTTQRRSRVQDN